MTNPNHPAFEHAPISCPKCGEVMDRSTVIDSDEPRHPEKGDITMCIGCGEFWQFDNHLKLGRLDETSLDEEVLAVIVKARLAYKFAVSRH